MSSSAARDKHIESKMFVQHEIQESKVVLWLRGQIALN